MKTFIRVRIAAGRLGERDQGRARRAVRPGGLAEPPGGGFGLLAWLLPLAALVGRRGRRRGFSLRSWSTAPRRRRRRTTPTSIPQLERLVDEELARFDGVSWTSIPVAFLAGIGLVPRAVRAAARPRVPVGGLGGRRRSARAAGNRAPGRHGRACRSSSASRRSSCCSESARRCVGGRILGDQFLLERIAGFVLVVFGLAFMGLLPWPERLVGAGLVQEARGRGSRVLLGGAFAVCAAPCIGPVLAAILVLAGSSDTVFQGAALLGVLLARARGPVRARGGALHASDVAPFAGSATTTARSRSAAARSWSRSASCSSSSASTCSACT